MDDSKRPARGSVLWTSPRLVAINKPAGLSLATGSGGEAAVRRLLGALSPEDLLHHALRPAELFLVHRLDEGTSGLVLLARDKAMHAAAARAFEKALARKSYLALSWGSPETTEGRWEWPLGPDRVDRRKMRADPKGKRAVTLFEVLGRASLVSLLELRPETGRTHQIRVHMAQAGHPIVGDDLYAGPLHRSVEDPRLRTALMPFRPLLHAWRLALPELLDSPPAALEAPWPDDFQRALQAAGIVWSGFA